MLKACELPALGRVNIGSGIETSIAAVHSLVSLSLGSGIPPQVTASRSGDVSQMCLRVDRAAEALGWVPQISLPDGIKSLASAAIGANS
jgi:UDP-glucose 4-epimerase